jgi:DNA polymerase-3 subunit alpha
VDEFLPELARFTRDRLANLKPERESQWLAGLVVDFRFTKSRRGEPIALIQLDDRSARFEISLFGKEYEQHRELLVKNSILVFDCLVSIDDYNGTMRGRGREVLTLDQARARFARSLDLRLRHDALTPDFMSALERQLQAHRAPPAVSSEAADGGHRPAPAGCPVRIFYERRGVRGTLVLGDQWRVMPSQPLLQALQEEFGRSAVALCYQS